MEYIDIVKDPFSRLACAAVADADDDDDGYF